VRDLESQVEGLKLELERLQRNAGVHFEQLETKIVELKKELTQKVTWGGA